MKAGEHKGVEIFFSNLSEQFWTSLNSPVKDLIDESYKGIVKQIDERLEEKELKPTYQFIDKDFIDKFAGSKTYENVTFKDCVFNMPKGYDKLSGAHKNIIDNLIQNFTENEKK